MEKSIMHTAPNAMRDVALNLETLLSEAFKDEFKTIVFVCIGTDRSTGDSLGPIIGYKLQGLNQYGDVFVYGDLHEPVHAKNLDETINKILEKHEKPYIVAIDACLGKAEHVGYIKIMNAPIKPGSAVKKDLTEVGNASIVGIVNFAGTMDFVILQNTRLSIVMNMANIISSAIKYALWQIKSKT